MGGKDHASARYIFTRLEKIARTIFHPDDDALLNYLNDDGISIEPDYYMPVIPMVLVNGSDGIGTGYSSTIHKHDPREIIANLRKMIQGEEPEIMHPHFAGFTGEVSNCYKILYIIHIHTEQAASLETLVRSLLRLVPELEATLLGVRLNASTIRLFSSANSLLASGHRTTSLAYWNQ